MVRAWGQPGVAPARAQRCKDGSAHGGVRIQHKTRGALRRTGPADSESGNVRCRTNGSNTSNTFRMGFICFHFRTNVSAFLGTRVRAHEGPFWPPAQPSPAFPGSSFALLTLPGEGDSTRRGHQEARACRGKAPARVFPRRGHPRGTRSAAARCGLVTDVSAVTAAATASPPFRARRGLSGCGSPRASCPRPSLEPRGPGPPPRRRRRLANSSASLPCERGSARCPVSAGGLL